MAAKALAKNFMLELGVNLWMINSFLRSIATITNSSPFLALHIPFLSATDMLKDTVDYV